MEQPTFWDNPEKAQQTIQQLKPLNALLKPFADLVTAGGDLGALTELCEEDASLELEVRLSREDRPLGAEHARLQEVEDLVQRPGLRHRDRLTMSLGASSGRRHVSHT